MRLEPEHLRILDDAATSYDAWLRARRALDALGPPLFWKTLGGVEYLYESRGSLGSTSRGRRDAGTERQKAEYDAAAELHQQTVQDTEARLKMLGAQYRALRLPRVHPTLGAVAREADQRGMLGSALLVIGTNAMPAYEIEAQELFLEGLTATQDCDFGWVAQTQLTMSRSDTAAPRPIYALLKAVDSTFTVNYERPFQARNSKGYEIEVLIGPESARTYPPSEDLRATPLPEQDWLTYGTPLQHVVFDTNGYPVRLVVPDPRWMALHKLWLADKPERNPLKVPKDREQGRRLARMVMTSMPRYPVDEAFKAALPAELQPYLVAFPQVVRPSGLDAGGFGEPTVRV